MTDATTVQNAIIACPGLQDRAPNASEVILLLSGGKNYHMF